MIPSDILTNIEDKCPVYKSCPLRKCDGDGGYWCTQECRGEKMREKVKQKSIMDILDEVCEEVCDSLCKWTVQSLNSLDGYCEEPEACKNCPLDKLR